MSTRPATDTPLPQLPQRESSQPGRVLMVVSAFCSVAAMGLASVWLLSSSPDEAAVLDVSDTVAAPPQTVPPVRTESEVAALQPPRAPTPVRPAEATPAVADSADPLSPLADLLGPTYSVIPDIIEDRPRPVGITTSSIDVDRFPVRSVGLEADGQLEVPDETEIGWYRYGATAGRPGATVLAAHVSWNKTTGPFFELGSMEPGDEINVALDDGTERRYLVTERTMYDKNDLPRERIWRTTGDEQLVLITCGGDFNPEIRRYRQNIVVYAAPIG